MADISKISPDDGSTILNIKDGNSVHWADNAVLGAVNLFPIDISTLKSKNTTGTWSGNTYTLNTLTLDCEVVNGYVTTITANGTPTSNVNFILFDGNSTTELANKLKGKSITLSGCPINGSSNSYRMLFSTWGSVPNEYDDGSGCTVNVPSNVSGLRFDCIVYSGYTANNIVFKPMLSISPNAVYAPYAMTNRELTPQKDVVSLESGITKWTENVLVRHAKTVLLNLSVSGTFTANIETLVGTIPMGFRPSQILFFTLGTTIGYGYVKFGQDGTIKVTNSANVSNVNINAFWQTP